MQSLDVFFIYRKIKSACLNFCLWSFGLRVGVWDKTTRQFETEKTYKSRGCRGGLSNYFTLELGALVCFWKWQDLEIKKNTKIQNEKDP